MQIDAALSTAEYASVLRQLRPLRAALAGNRHTMLSSPSRCSPPSQPPCSFVMIEALCTDGLIGGVGFEGSATYYRMINEGVRSRLGCIDGDEDWLGLFLVKTNSRSAMRLVTRCLTFYVRIFFELCSE